MKPCVQEIVEERVKVTVRLMCKHKCAELCCAVLKLIVISSNIDRTGDQLVKVKVKVIVKVKVKVKVEKNEYRNDELPHFILMRVVIFSINDKDKEINSKNRSGLKHK